VLKFVEASLSQNAEHFAAACYIVAESRDSTLARQTVSAFARLPYRPLSGFHDERTASARNVASALWLADEAGFEWFYGQYLNPRYPFPQAGSAIISDVFKEWAVLARGRPGLAYVQRLRELVVPYLATGEAHFFGVLDVLSLLVPDGFKDEDRLWYQSSALESERLGDWAFESLRSAAMAPSLRTKLDDVLARRLGSGIGALNLWLNLNPHGQVPTDALRTAFRVLSGASNAERETRVVADCRKRLGSEPWIRFARWHVSSDDRAVAAGAAIALYEHGERRLAQLGDALVHALHDGAYVAKAEELLSDVVSLTGEKGVRWLASKVADGGAYDGAHSGSWRILLSRVDSLDDGPIVLAACARSLGHFTIPRYPEIREAFRHLLNGSRGSEYRGTLRRQLDNIDPESRLGAAKILVATDPAGEGEALVTVVRGRGVERDSHEWEEFCLTLEFGPGSLTTLQSQLGDLGPMSRAFALALLSNAGMDIGLKSQDEFLRCLLLLENWTLASSSCGHAVLATEKAFELLSEQLDRPDSAVARRAAQELLRLHAPRLSPIIEAKCLALGGTPRALYDSLSQMLHRISHDAEFANALGQACREIREQGGAVPIVESLLAAMEGRESWKEPLWLMLCDDSGGVGGSSEADHVHGPTLFEFGLASPIHRAQIGEAAIACLRDPRMERNRWTDAYHWLVLLADEFAAVNPETITSALRRGDPIYCAAAAALIARLGSVPEAVRFNRVTRQRHHRPPANRPCAASLQHALELLADVSRDSETLHPDTLWAIEEMLLFPPISEQELSNFAHKSHVGILIAAVLRHCYGTPAHLSESLPLFDIWGRLWGRSQPSPGAVRLLNVWNTVRRLALEGSGPTTVSYLDELDRKLLGRGIWQIPLATEILQIRGSLLPTQIEPIFLEYARHATFLHRRLFGPLVKWLSGEFPDPVKDAVRQAAYVAILHLNETPWVPAQGSAINVWALCLFPVVFWSLDGKTSAAANAVFLRGLQGALEQDTKRYSSDEQVNLVAEVLSTLEPLLRRVPGEILKSMVQSGHSVPSPVLRSFCRLVQSVAGMTMGQ
jgi:hypothetical protein